MNLLSRTYFDNDAPSLTTLRGAVGFSISRSALDAGSNTKIQAVFSHCGVLSVGLPTHVLATYCVSVCLGADLVPAPRWATGTCASCWSSACTRGSTA